jgi:HD superfamily phosphohydrolase
MKRHLQFRDILYGTVAIPDWLGPFLKMPEFVRLRGIRLSNVDSFEFKDLAGPTRWEHCVAVAALADRCAAERGATSRDRVHLVLAALLHDIATPPFAHTMEYVLQGFDHESESQQILVSPSTSSKAEMPIFASQMPMFAKLCERLSSQLKMTVDPEEVGRLVVGEGELGFLINGTVDLDNADNVTRASMFMGWPVDSKVPLDIVSWLATQTEPPVDLSKSKIDAVQIWLEYRDRLYETFYKSSDEELGRQAFLQHLCRRALETSIPRLAILRNTDEGFLHLLEGIGESGSQRSLRELVQRYRLLEAPIAIAEVPIADGDTLRAILSPAAIAWIEKHLKGVGFEPFVFGSVKRFRCREEKSLFPPVLGRLQVFKLGDAIKRNQFPDWIRKYLPEKFTIGTVKRHLSNALEICISDWVRSKPWLAFDESRKSDVVRNLQAVGDWRFRLSKNEALHSYPSTFVHAIPSCLIGALGLSGQTIVDPFGGTGQTALEAINAGGIGISGDINLVALLVARSKLTPLSEPERASLRSVSEGDVRDSIPCEAPTFELREKWHHPETLKELCQIKGYIGRVQNARVQQFLLMTFSSILTMATGRRGKEHGFFADNTPLAKFQTSPPYQNAYDLFFRKTQQNLWVIDRMYASLERSGRDPLAELSRARVVRADIKNATPGDYGIGENEAAGVITSPPYLCMSDYSLGQRLAYYWLSPEKLAIDHSQEIGARRKRAKPSAAKEAYFEGLMTFGVLSRRLLRDGGFLGVVLGAPVAQAFEDAAVIEKSDEIFSSCGFSPVWSYWRDIQWHRNHGYARLKRERISVYVKV